MWKHSRECCHDFFISSIFASASWQSRRKRGFPVESLVYPPFYVPKPWYAYVPGSITDRVGFSLSNAAVRWTMIIMHRGSRPWIVNSEFRITQMDQREGGSYPTQARGRRCQLDRRGEAPGADRDWIESGACPDLGGTGHEDWSDFGVYVWGRMREKEPERRHNQSTRHARGIE